MPGRDGKPLIAPHLKTLRPFLGKGDFAPVAFGHDLVDTLQPADFTIEKVAYSAFYQTGLEYIMRALGIDHLIIGGIVTHGGVASIRLGRPDIGLTSVSEMADTMALIADRIDLPVIIDADTGFGNALNAQRTMRQYERAGASALPVEDQTYPKRCGHLADKTLIPTTEMAGKIDAMADARISDQTLIVARTDAIAVEGFQAALDRAGAYVEAGADVLFIEAR